MKSIAILGANGRLANLAVKAFNQRGYKVIAITRNGQLRDAPTGVERRAADASDVEALITACAGADFILHALNPPYHRWDELAMPLTRSVLAAARAVNATLLFPGNVYNFGSTIPSVVDAQTAFNPDHGKARVRIEMEKLMQEAAVNDGLKVVILRAGDFYGGKGKGSWFDMALAKQVKKGKFEYPGDPTIDHAWAYLPDFANAFVDLANHAEHCSPFVDFLFEGHCLSGDAFAKLLSDAVGKPLKPVTSPWGLFKVLGLFMPVLREVIAMRYLWDRPHRLDGSRLRALIPELQITPPADAVAQALADFNAAT